MLRLRFSFNQYLQILLLFAAFNLECYRFFYFISIKLSFQFRFYLRWLLTGNHNQLLVFKSHQQMAILLGQIQALNRSLQPHSLNCFKLKNFFKNNLRGCHKSVRLAVARFLAHINSLLIDLVKRKHAMLVINDHIMQRVSQIFRMQQISIHRKQLNYMMR